MDFNAYQEISRNTRTYTNEGQTYDVNPYVLLTISRWCAGVAGEAGELNEALKKYLRRDYDYDELRARIIAEGGDILWYLAQLFDDFNVDFSEVAEYNVEKLMARREAGTIKGDGEDR